MTAPEVTGKPEGVNKGGALVKGLNPPTGGPLVGSGGLKERSTEVGVDVVTVVFALLEVLTPVAPAYEEVVGVGGGGGALLARCC